MVGLGTQDDLAYAKDFVESRGTMSFTMLWDPGFESWAALGVYGQPGAMLLSPEGEKIKFWAGVFPAEEALELARGL